MQTFLPLLLVGLVACSSPEPQNAEGTTESSEAAEAGASDRSGSLEALRENVAGTMAKPEHDATRVEVAHILIAFRGAARSTQTRSQEEAEALTAELLSRALEGADFDALVAEYSNDPGPGPYMMQTDGSAGFPRSQMAKAFGDVGWRLGVGEIGVAGYHPRDSVFGWHIIKRLQ